MITPDPKCTDCPLAAVAAVDEKPAEALWLLLAAPVEAVAFNAALAAREAISVSDRVGA